MLRHINLLATPLKLNSSVARTNFFQINNVHIALSSRAFAVHRGARTRPVAVKTKKVQKGEKNVPIVGEIVEERPMSNQQQYSQYVQDPQYTSGMYNYGDQNASQTVESSVSLKAFIRRVMGTTALGVGVTAVATAGFLQIPLVLASPMASMIVGFVGALGCMFAMNRSPPTYVQEGEVIRSVDSNARKALFGGLVVSQGLVIAPSLALTAAVAPIAIPAAGALAVATMAGMGVFALKQPTGSLLKWGPALTVGIFGLIGVGLVNAIFIGSSTVAMIGSVAGIGIFSAFTAYDVHVAIQEHNEGRPDHLSHAASFYLNFINLFMDFLRLFRHMFQD